MRDHGLLLANALLFVVFLVGMTATGYRVHNNEQVEHGQPVESVGSYLTSGDFFEATFENWESEFLQMGMYVVLTAYLFQRGSSESKPMDEEPPQDEDPRTKANDPNAPWPVRRGGLILRLYEHSLSGLFFLLALNQLVVSILGAADERGNYAYILRVVGFVLILFAIVDKNRSPSRKTVTGSNRRTL